MLTCNVGLLSGVGTWEGISIRHPHIPRPWNPIRAWAKIPWLCLAVESTDACKTRGEVARGVTWGHREVRAGQSVAHGGGDGHGRWCNALSSCAHPLLLPPPNGEAEAHTSPPMLCHEARLGAYGAVTYAQLL